MRSASSVPKYFTSPVNDVERDKTFQFASYVTVEPSRVSVPPRKVPSPAVCPAPAYSKTQFSEVSTEPSALSILKLPVSITYSWPACLSDGVPVAATVSLRFSHSLAPSLPPSPRNPPTAFS